MKKLFVLGLFFIQSVTVFAQHDGHKNPNDDHWGYDCYQMTLKKLTQNFTEEWRAKMKASCRNVRNQYAFACVQTVYSNFRSSAYWDSWVNACAHIHKQVGLNCVNDLFQRYSRCNWSQEILDCSMWK